MGRPLSHWAYVAGTGAGFAGFGIAGLTLGLVGFPLLHLLPGERSRKQLRCQRVVNRVFRGYVECLEWMGVAKLTVRNAERLAGPGPHLVVANHPTLLDVVVIGTLLPQMDCVAKSDAFSNPFMWGVVKATGYLSNADGPALVEACAERIRSGRSLLIFPEGTRSPRGGLGPFHRGAIHVAMRTGVPLIPVFVRCEPPSLAKGQKWWDVPGETLHFRLEVGEPLSVAELTAAGGPRGAATRRATAALRDFYAKKLQYLGSERRPDAVETRDLRLGDGSTGA
jgi:1-acyl-sn-glycerol-3-phosphate acyltransferase